MGTKRTKKKILIHFAKREIDQDTFRACLVVLLCKWLLSKESEDPLFCSQVKHRPYLPFLETNMNIRAEIPLLAPEVQLFASFT
jgi:hypothetical protein